MDKKVNYQQIYYNMAQKKVISRNTVNHFRRCIIRDWRIDIIFDALFK